MKKVLKGCLIVIVVIICMWLLFFTVDYIRVENQELPIFCIKSPGGGYSDGGTMEYLGLGYKVIDFNRLNGYDEIKIGTCSMKYEDFQNEYNNVPELIPDELIEAYGFVAGKAITIKGENYNTIIEILNRQIFENEISITIKGEDYKTVIHTLQNNLYDDQVCTTYDTYVIRINAGSVYYISPNNNAIVTNGKQAQISNEDIQEIENIIEESNSKH